ncbi:MAG: hypothetical protein IJT21_08640 [Synergistaceae bacterium]|nr:hypothetical protein [Synergistaceae bacterium]
MIDKIIDELNDIKRILKHRSTELYLIEHLKELDTRRSDWERRSALFVPSRQRLERGAKTLELGESYEAIKDLRAEREKNRIKQDSLRNDLLTARTELQNAEEALTLIETEYRDKLAEQTKLNNLAQRVRALDGQIIERSEAVINTRQEFDESEKKLRECSAKVEQARLSLERLEIELREARKFLQVRTTDEKLIAGLPGIQKCFSMYEKSEEKRLALKSLWEGAIQKRQQAQSSLNDRSALFSDVMHRFEVIEKKYTRARAYYESTLKGKSIPEWREICEKSIKKLAELDELYRKFQEAKSLEDKLKILQENKLRVQQETRNLNLRDVEQSARLNELEAEAAKLERRVALLRRIQDLDAVRELLQDGLPCPLCGSLTHPYTSGAVVPNPEEVHNQLLEAQSNLDKLRDELTSRQTKTGKLNEEIESITRDESDLRKQLNALNAEISAKVSIMGLKLSTGISPFEEIDRERQKTRDSLQLARSTADTAEAAEHDMKTAADELDKITRTREEITKFHQDALFSLHNEKSDESRFENEVKTQEEIVNSLKRELISQIMPYGYKTLPDKNPGEVISALEKRLNDWQEGSRKRDLLEREVSVSQTKFAALKKEKESLRLKREELASRVKGVESERDSLQQQRIILFASRKPDDEQERMNKDVETLRTRLNECRETKNDKSAKLDKLLTEIHTLETQMARARDDIQKHEVNFGKKLLALGFKNEDDYAASCLTSDERRDLQNKLRDLTREDLDIKSEHENTRAKLIELQSEGVKFDPESMQSRLSVVKDLIRQNQSENISSETLNEIRELAKKCGLSEVL